MFERVITQTIQRISSEVLRDRQSVPLTEILEDERIPSRFKPFFATEVRWWLFNDALARGANKRFDFAHPEVASLLDYLEQVMFRHARFEHDEFVSTLDGAVKLTFNYLCRPQTTLKWYIFRGQPVKPLNEVMLRFESFLDYEYIGNVFAEWVEQKVRERATFEAISATEFERIIRRIDDQILLSCTVDELLELLDPIFDFIGEGEEQVVPLDALIIFFDDKNIARLVDHLEGYRQTHASVSRARFVAILEELLTSAEENPEADFSSVYQNDELDDIVQRHLAAEGRIPPPPHDAPVNEPPATPVHSRAEEPLTHEPRVRDVPAHEAREHGTPAHDAQAHEPPAHEAPAHEQHGQEAYVHEAHEHEVNVHEAPAHEQHGQEAYVHEAHELNAPAHEPPAHEQPVHVPPAHEPPVHVPPAHEPPAHEPPEHESPAHESPVNEAHLNEPTAHEAHAPEVPGEEEHGAETQLQASHENVPPTSDAATTSAQTLEVPSEGEPADLNEPASIDDVVAALEDADAGGGEITDDESIEDTAADSGEDGGDGAVDGSSDSGGRSLITTLGEPARVDEAPVHQPFPEPLETDAGASERPAANAAVHPSALDPMLERKVLKKVFNRERAAYDQTMARLATAATWREASQILDEIFIRFDVDPYSRTALRFTDSIYTRYVPSHN